MARKDTFFELIHYLQCCSITTSKYSFWSLWADLLLLILALATVCPGPNALQFRSLSGLLFLVLCLCIDELRAHFDRWEHSIAQSHCKLTHLCKLTELIVGTTFTLGPAKHGCVLHLLGQSMQPENYALLAHRAHLSTQMIGLVVETSSCINSFWLNFPKHLALLSKPRLDYAGDSSIIRRSTSSWDLGDFQQQMCLHVNQFWW
jgi:hypothetical protein